MVTWNTFPTRYKVLNIAPSVLAFIKPWPAAVHRNLILFRSGRSNLIRWAPLQTTN